MAGQSSTAPTMSSKSARGDRMNGEGAGADRGGPVLVRAEEGFHGRHGLVHLAAPAQRQRLEAGHAQVTRVVRHRGVRRGRRGRVVLRRELRAHEVHRCRRIVRGELARVLEGLDGLVELAELLVREAKVRQQHAERERTVGSAAERTHHRRQRVDHALVLTLVFQGLGEDEVPARPLGVLRNGLAGRGLGGDGVACTALGLGQQRQRALDLIRDGVCLVFRKRAVEQQVFSSGVYYGE